MSTFRLELGFAGKVDFFIRNLFQAVKVLVKLTRNSILEVEKLSCAPALILVTFFESRRLTNFLSGLLSRTNDELQKFG